MRHYYVNLLGSWVEADGVETVWTDPTPEPISDQQSLFGGTFLAVKHDENVYCVHPSCVQAIED